MKKCSLLILIVVLVTSLLAPKTVYALGSDLTVEDMSFENSEKSARNALMKNLQSHLEVFATDTGSTRACLDKLSEITIFEGFRVYQRGAEKDESSLTFYYPIVQNKEVKLLAAVDKIGDNTWNISISEYGASYINRYSDYLSYTIYSEGDTWIFAPKAASERRAPEVIGRYHLEHSKTLSLLSRETKGNQSDKFYVNTDTYKFLNMDNCLMLQEADGTKYGLCWAASAATMIRYITGNRTVSAFSIADEFHIGYNDGIETLSTIRSALLRHGVTSQYRYVARQAVSLTEIYHNINNAYPIAMGMQGRVLSVIPYGKHVVTIVGYNGSTLIMWESARGKIVTTSYNDKKTTYKLFAYTYTWIQSVLIPLP